MKLEEIFSTGDQVVQQLNDDELNMLKGGAAPGGGSSCGKGGGCTAGGGCNSGSKCDAGGGPCRVDDPISAW